MTRDSAAMTKRLMIILAAVAAVLVAAAAATAKTNDTTITGAGSTFVQPLVAAWTPALGEACSPARPSSKATSLAVQKPARAVHTTSNPAARVAPLRSG